MYSHPGYYNTYEQEESSAEEDRDDGLKSSDEEDIEKNMANFFSKTKKIVIENKKIKNKEVANDFESEMNSELDKLVEKETKTYAKFLGSKEDVQMKEVESSSSLKKTFVEEDTDSEAELETGIRTTKKRPQFTNDELFYDPEMDTLDENWINKQRATCRKLKAKSVVKKEQEKSEKDTDLANQVSYSSAQTDAILNCPCCMNLLCMDCQRHEKYKTQYRAMFVFNCKVKEDEQLKYPKEEDGPEVGGKKGKRKSKKTVQEEISDKPVEFEIFKPVECESCRTEVGVYDDKEEIYYFFNTLASHS